MNISSMKELDHLTVDKIADAFGRVNCKCSDFIRENECTYDPIKDSLVWREVSGEERIPRRLLREAETIHEEMVKKEKETMRTAIPTTISVVQRKNTTVVNWDDGAKTVVTLKPDECLDMMFVGFCIAYTKRMLGSTTNILKMIEKNDTDTINKRKKEFEEQIKKTMREANEQQEKAQFEAAVQAKMYEDRVIEEAIRRIRIRNERKMNNDET